MYDEKAAKQLRPGPKPAHSQAAGGRISGVAPDVVVNYVADADLRALRPARFLRMGCGSAT